MKINIFIPKDIIIFFLLLCIGVGCVFYGASSLYKIKHCVNFQELTPEGCRKGGFVAGNLDSYLVARMMGLEDGHYSGSSQLWIEGIREYEFYTVPIAEEHYIGVLVADKETLDSLERYEKGNETDVYFEGKIVKALVSINTSWYDGVEQEGFHIDQIISDYVIKETDFDKPRQVLYGGFLFLAMAIVQFVKMKGFSEIQFHKE